MSGLRNQVGKLAVYVEGIGLVLNIGTLYLISRQGLGSPDMYLALILAVCDICLVISKLGVYTYYASTSDFSIFSSVWFGQLDGLVMCLLISTSVLCIGYLAVLRCWAIFLKRKISNKLWLGVFLVQQSIVLLFLVATANSHEFKLAPFGRYFYPDPTSSNFFTCASILMFSSWVLFSIVSVNVAYPVICYTYILQINTAALCLYWRPCAIAQFHLKQKIAVILRILLLMIIYDLVMVPAFFIITKEFLQHRLRSVAQDSFLSFCLLGLVIVNPLTLIFLHQDIFNDVKSIIASLFPSSVSHQYPN
ncbi:hypothetical protein DSO57_1037762 [Entomophthora muscae]|uniref:Uncharacterized protein n=1 Tax=Entomophthora muscae TaxID=34485 RepID=A0ACC2TXF0_9FUNG|nr:hypothetical protein DSO57_1037762 [Entomophthora muscae]